jgi:hypothetical protein
MFSILKNAHAHARVQPGRFMQNFWQQITEPNVVGQKTVKQKAVKRMQRLTLNFMVFVVLMVGTAIPLSSFGEHAFPGLEPAVLWAFQRSDPEAPHARQVQHARQLAGRLQRQFIHLFHLLTPGASNDLAAFRQLARNLPVVVQWAENQRFLALHGTQVRDVWRQGSVSPPVSPGGSLALSPPSTPETPVDELRGRFCFTDGTPRKSTSDVMKGIYEAAGNGGGQGQGQGQGGQGAGQGQGQGQGQGGQGAGQGQGQGNGGQGQANGCMAS